MVDPIRGGVVYTPGEYGKKNKGNNNSEFSLNQNESNVIKNPDNVKKNDDLLKAGVDNSGVELNISRDNDKSGNAEEVIIDNSLFVEIKQKVYDAIEYVKNIFSRIWNGTEESNSEVKESKVQGEVTDVTDIDSIIKKRDINMLEAYVTENGSKKIANNSDLLTRYDKRGNIVEIDPSEKNAIMHNRERDRSAY